jgi:predicted small lipoprotein YifL
VRRALVALALLAALAGCTAPGPAAAPVGDTSSAPPAAVAWADTLCAAILDYDTNAASFQLDSSSPSAAVNSVRTYLDTTVNQIAGTKTRLTTIGPAPVAGGDEAAQALVQSLDTLSQTVEAARTRIGAVDANDRTAVNAALQDIANTLQSLRTPVNPLEGMGERFPDLQAAARSADNCTEVSRTRASRAALPPLSSTTSSTTTSPPTS